MADYITTHSGIHFEPTDPKAEQIEITDIAHALPYICRGNGHVKTFFSVAQHCIHCALEAEARQLSPRIRLALLLHDASECYMSDVPRPFKKYLTEYLAFEERILKLIYEKYLGSDLDVQEQRILKQIDDDMLYYDLLILLNEPSNVPEPDLKTKISYEVLPFEMVEQRYLRLFYLFEGDVLLERFQKAGKDMSSLDTEKLYNVILECYKKAEMLGCEAAKERLVKLECSGDGEMVRKKAAGEGNEQ